MTNPFRKSALVTAVLCVCFEIVGCSPPPIDESKINGVTAQRTEADEVSTLLSALRAETLGFVDGTDVTVRQLNRWAESSDSVTSLLGGTSGDVSTTRFSAADARHVRDRLLDAEVVESLIADTPGDVDRLRKLFAHVCRHVERVGSDATPRTTFEVRLIGRGTAAERAWLFCDLVRQLKLEAALLVPGDDVAAPERGGPFVVAVFAGGEAYLFDPAAGLAVPAGRDDAAAVPEDVVPVTFRDVLADPTLLAFADATSDESWNADSLRASRLLTVETAADGRPVIDAFESMLPPDVTAVLFDPPESSSAGPGLNERLADAARAAGLGDAGLTRWDYPDRRIAAFDAAGGRQAQGLRIAMLPFEAPLGEEGEPLREQLAARLDQLRGRGREASKVFQLVRVDGSATSLRATKDLSANQRTMYRLAADDAHYWTAVCQYAVGNDRAVISTAASYAKAGGPRAAAAEALRALAEARSGLTAEAATRAVALVEAGRADAGLGWLATRWSTPASAEDDGDRDDETVAEENVADDSPADIDAGDAT